MAVKKLDKDTVTFEWHEIKRVFLDTVRNGRIESNFHIERNVNQVKTFVKQWERGQKWDGGCSSADTVRYLEKGYNITGYEIEDAGISPLRKKRAMKFSDSEGDYNHDLFISGVDNYYSEMSRRDRTPGVDIKFGIAFVCTQSGDIIVEYEKWMLKSLVDLEASGIDFTLMFQTKLRDPFQDHSLGELTLNIIVKRENEATDFNEWSALLSPGGFRQIIFLAIILAADRAGKVVHSYLGYPVPNDAYSVDYNYKTEAIYINNSTSHAVFSESKMNEMFITSIEDAKRGLNDR